MGKHLDDSIVDPYNHINDYIVEPPENKYDFIYDHIDDDLIMPIAPMEIGRWYYHQTEDIFDSEKIIDAYDWGYLTHRLTKITRYNRNEWFKNFNQSLYDKYTFKKAFEEKGKGK